MLAIAARHYVQVTDGDFQKASGTPNSAAQIPAQQPSELGGNEGKGTEDGKRLPQRQEDITTSPCKALRPLSSRCCNSLLHKTLGKVEDTRLELVTSCMPCKRSPN